MRAWEQPPSAVHDLVVSTSLLLNICATILSFAQMDSRGRLSPRALAASIHPQRFPPAESAGGSCH